MSQATISSTVNIPFTKRLIGGVLGGIAGGLVFGVMMGMMGMLTMIASMAGSDSAAVGFLIHMMISIIFGLGFAIVPGSILDSFGKSAGAGVVYVIVLWVVGPLVMMPLMMGMPLFSINQAAMMSLMGHIIFGVVTAIVASLLAKKNA